MLETKPILFSEQRVGSQNIGFIQLNRPNALNSLNLEMVQSLYNKLIFWEQREDIACLFIFSELEKSFCAGGDVKKVVLSQKDEPSYAEDFFYYEYLADEFLSRYKKPVFCWGSGIVMGGGMGIFMASSHRIATDTTSIAMPEVAIGFFPDVGASYFLHQIPQKFGWLMALSGHRIDGEMAVSLGLARTIVSAKMRRKFISDLLSLKWSKDPKENFLTADKLLEQIRYAPEVQITSLLDQTEKIFSEKDLSDALNRWKGANDSTLDKAYRSMASGSYNSVQITWELLQRSMAWSRTESSWWDWELAQRFCRLPEFHEGIRAMLIDKDKSPKWSTSPLSASDLSSFFRLDPSNKIKKLLVS